MIGSFRIYKLFKINLFLRYDKILLYKNPRAADIAKELSGSNKPSLRETQDASSLMPPPTKQFGVSLQFIKENNKEVVDSIPPIVRQCVEFLSQPDGKFVDVYSSVRRYSKPYSSLLYQWISKCPLKL